MKVLDIVLRGGAEVRRILTDEACVAFLEEVEKIVGAIPLDAAGRKRRRSAAPKKILLRQSDIAGQPFYVDAEEIAAITVAEFELKDF